ncbi:MFS transporter [Microbispora bryophytorum]|uniref:MFS transporter n=1 Tax=Microbispora bryophytorum subsp. camponoti TaxID=1677852 RepID=A0ABR8LA74_9ACTN|nr:MFS transporter [Microbispora camponoti]MBD3145348.1 MFS transporter [Microbispora camponoti]
MSVRSGRSGGHGELPPLRRNSRFQMLWMGAAASELGTTLTWVAFPLLILAVTGSAALAGLVGACRITANLLFSLPAGAWVDRWDRRRILIAAEVVRCLALAALAAAVLTGRVALWQIVAVAMVTGAADSFFGPARAAAIRAVVAPGQLPEAYAREEARGHAASLAGPPLGGFLFGLGRALPFAVDALTYLVSLVCVVRARVPRRPAEAAEAAERRETGMRADVMEAAGWLWRHRGLRAGLAFALVANLAANALLLPVIVMVEARGGDAAATGVVLAGLGLGGLLGATLSARIGRLLPPGRLMLAVVGFFALAVCATALPFGPYWPVVPLFLAMVAAPALNVVLRVLLARLVPDAMTGRVFSVFTLATMGLTPVGPLLGGLLAQYAGGAGALVAVGGLLAAGCAVAAISPALRGLDVPAAAGSAPSAVPVLAELGREPVSER